MVNIQLFEKCIFIDHMEYCRLCLKLGLDPNIKFFDIFSPNYDGVKLDIVIMEFCKTIKIDKNDWKSNVICQNCLESMLQYVRMRKVAANSQKVIDYLAEKIRETLETDSD